MTEICIINSTVDSLEIESKIVAITQEKNEKEIAKDKNNKVYDKMNDDVNLNVPMMQESPIRMENFTYSEVTLPKFNMLYAMKTISTKACLNKVVNNYIPKYGNPKVILSDNASLFKSKKWSQPLKRY